MSRKWITRALVTATVTASVAAGGVLPAAAAAGPAPGTGYIGGCNMLNDPTMFTVAMVHASERGNIGMFIAVARSGDPGTCQRSLS